MHTQGTRTYTVKPKYVTNEVIRQLMIASQQLSRISWMQTDR